MKINQKIVTRYIRTTCFTVLPAVSVKTVVATAQIRNVESSPVKLEFSY